MSKHYSETNSAPQISDLYPQASPEQQAAAEYRLRRYLAVVKRIFERVVRQQPDILTELERRAMLRKSGNKTCN